MTHPSCQKFGTTAAGEQVERLTLDNGCLSCAIITFGAALRALFVPDREGRRTDVVLGYDTLEEYQNQDGYLGASDQSCLLQSGRSDVRSRAGTGNCHSSQYYTPTDASSIPLGVLKAVEGTPMDLRALTPLGAHIDAPFLQLVRRRGYDHTYAVDGELGQLRHTARARALIIRPGFLFWPSNERLKTFVRQENTSGDSFYTGSCFC